jgi:hypothetical protein
MIPRAGLVEKNQARRKLACPGFDFSAAFAIRMQDCHIGLL